MKFDDFVDTGSILQVNGESGTAIDGVSKALKFDNKVEEKAGTGGSIFTKNPIRLNDDLSFSTAFFFAVAADTDWSKLGDGGFTFTLQSAGTGAGKFSPNADIAREQLAVIAYRLYQYKRGKIDGIEENTFADSHDISQYAKDAVDFVQNAGIMQGSGGMFYPKQNTTRQEAAAVLYRLLEHLGEI